MTSRCEICSCRFCSEEICWADVEAGDEFVSELLQDRNRARELQHSAEAMAEYRRQQLVRFGEGAGRPTLGGLVQDIARWQAQTFPSGSAEGALNHLQREVREVCSSGSDLGEELADCLFLWCQLVTRYHLGPSSFFIARRRFERLKLVSGVRLIDDDGSKYRQADRILVEILAFATAFDIDLIAEASKKLKINQDREWQAPDEHGVVEHVRD